jgi:hypothetical protein
VFTHETNKSRKLLLEIGQTGGLDGSRGALLAPARTSLFADETNKSWKLQLEIGQIGYSNLTNRRVRFDQVQRQLGAPSAPTRVSFSRPSCV